MDLPILRFSIKYKCHYYRTSGLVIHNLNYVVLAIEHNSFLLSRREKIYDNLRSHLNSHNQHESTRKQSSHSDL